MLFRAEVAGRFAASGAGEVCAVFQRSFYLRIEDRYACVGHPALGRGPLNALVREYRAPALGERVSVSAELTWTPPPFRAIEISSLQKNLKVPDEGLGCLLIGEHNALSAHAEPALGALDAWLDGHALQDEAEGLIGLGPGLTPSGDDYLGGVLIALHARERAQQAGSLWRWLAPRLARRTSALSAAHLAAAAAGEGHELLHAVLNGDAAPERLDAVGHCSGWDALAGAAAVLRH